MNQIELHLTVGAVFFLGGAVKGVVGFGLPLVSITLLTPLYGLIDAIGMMLLPAIITNFWQAISGGRFITIWRRLWGLLLPGALFTWLTANVLAQVDAYWPTVLLGLVILAYSGTGLWSWQPPEPGHREKWLSPLAGMLTGVFSGLTGVLVFPLAVYLQALRLDRQILLQAMGIYLLLANLVLASVFSWQGLFPQGIVSLAMTGVTAGLVGMALGRLIQKRLSERQFKRVFFLSLGVLGIYVFLGALSA
ncbi:MAG: hypothetical protein CL395_06280 [Acidiferrobacteraceae bacterium]|jgi:hypothetical protein|nr:hypothetical protein [Acidiferrobacteraceae bacterium]MCP4828402.1 sulfite exporter TauE/SafE family protein [Pseudomonadota bacterium]HJP07824.1 sulfite exporter TauE/SafE family protein [Arenicellales bacterium]|tara:strand:+ start:2488 stop:3234 length:747 start_codon:yes stop_codon:yes gene_type:complete